MSTPYSSKEFLTSILLPLSSITPPLPPSTTSHASISTTTTTTNITPTTPLTTLTGLDQQQTKSTLLTLHFLFPHELLPALDLIDRRLITRFTHTTAPLPSTTPSTEIYYVQSASTQSRHSTGRFRNALPSIQSYEVRLDAWNCSCPAFAYSALKLMMRAGRGDMMVDLQRETDVQWEGQWLVGGTATVADTVPVCKHILAVVLTKAAPALFGLGVLEREVGREELAGWVAGWGDR